MNEKTPTLKAVLNIETSKEYEISYKSQFIDYFKIDTIENKIKYTWNTSYENLIDPELYAPPFFNFLPYVSVVPKKFNFDIKGSLNSWLSFGNWQANLMKDLSDLPENEKLKISLLIKDIKES